MSTLTPSPDLVPTLETPSRASVPASDVATVTDKGASDQVSVPRKTEPFPYSPPVWKFALFSLVTAGLYGLYWCYRLWSFLKIERGLKINAFARSLFSGLFAGALVGAVREYLISVGRKSELWALSAGVGYFFLNAFAKLPDPYWLVTFLAFVPLIPAVSELRGLAVEKGYADRDGKVRWWQWLLSVVGLAYLALVLLGTFLPDEEFSETGAGNSATEEYGNGYSEDESAPAADPYDAEFTG